MNISESIKKNKNKKIIGKDANNIMEEDSDESLEYLVSENEKDIEILKDSNRVKLLFKDLLDIKIPYSDKYKEELLIKKNYNIVEGIRQYLDNIYIELEKDYVYLGLSELKHTHNYSNYKGIIKQLIFNNFELDNLIKSLPVLPDTPSKIDNKIPDVLNLDEEKKIKLKEETLKNVDKAKNLKSKLEDYILDPEFKELTNNLRKKVLVDIEFLENLISIFERPDDYDDLLYYKHQRHFFEKYYPTLYKNPDILAKEYPEIYKLLQ